RLGVLEESEREVVDPAAVAVVDLRSGREIARLNDTHQLLIAQVVHLPCFSLFGRRHVEKVTGPVCGNHTTITGIACRTSSPLVLRGRSGGGQPEMLFCTEPDDLVSRRASLEHSHR